MKTPQILTGHQAIYQYGLNALIECRVAVTTELNGLGHSVMQIGVIADPDNCFIDLSDEPAVLYVEIEQDDDWILHPIMADEQFVLLDDKNQPASNELLARRIVELTAERDAAKYKLAGVMDEISDFCASLDGALMANKGSDELADDIQRRLSHYGINDSDRELVRHNDDLAVDRFAVAMKIKLAAARAKGRSGWNDKESCSGEHLAQLLVEHLGKGNTGTFEDVANFAMMLHQRRESTQLMAQCLAEHNVGVVDSFDAFIEMVFPQEDVNFDTYAAALNMFREQLRQADKAGD